MRNIVKIALGLVLTLVLSTTTLASSWATRFSQDQDIGFPYWQCEIEEFGPTGMSENDEWYFVQEGVLSAGDVWQVSNPRPVCMELAVRVAWRFIGNGRAPSGIQLEIIDPVGGATYRQDLFTIVDTKGGRPVWVRQCTNVGGREGFGTYVFRVSNTSTKNVKLRVAASAAAVEFPIHQCPNWITALNNYGI